MTAAALQLLRRRASSTSRTVGAPAPLVVPRGAAPGEAEEAGAVAASTISISFQ